MIVVLKMLAYLAGLYILSRLLRFILIKTGKAKPQPRLNRKPLYKYNHYLKDDPKERGFVPTENDIEGIEVNTHQFPVNESFPLPYEKSDVWLVFGKKVDLRNTTITTLSRALSAKGYHLQHYEGVLGYITPEAFAYNFPWIKPEKDILSSERFTKAITEGLGINIEEKDILFVRYYGKADPTLFDQSERDAFEVYKDSATDSKDFLIKAFAYIESLRTLIKNSGQDSSGLRFRKADSYNLPDAKLSPDEIFDNGLSSVAMETYFKLSHLIMSGYSIEVIEGWLKQLSKPSRVVITKDYRILLPDYNNMEITMTQLPKTVFLFFLWFDIRCAIYQLQDHRDEFLAIYQQLSKFDDPKAMEDSIDRLVAPNGVSFMEKCSAVKKAFTTKMSDRQAKYYYIYGEQGYSKGIDLDRSLVTWEVQLFSKGR